MTGLRLERTLPAPPERVWRALTEASPLTAWFWPAHFAATVRVDARPGGELRIAAADGLAVSGRFREVEAPRRLVFTWRWDGDPAVADSAGDEDEEAADDEETLVTIELSAADGRTALVLTHEGFAADTTRDDHRTGWSDCLDRLPGWLTAPASHP
jgi:uncharacterized protein YndB with AHSA1/START domain